MRSLPAVAAITTVLLAATPPIAASAAPVTETAVQVSAAATQPGQAGDSQTKADIAYNQLRERLRLGDRVSSTTGLKDGGVLITTQNAHLYASDDWPVAIPVVNGAVWDQYSAAGAESGWLGYPIGVAQYSDMFKVSYQNFQGGWIAVTDDGAVTTGTGRYEEHAPQTGQEWVKNWVKAMYTNTGAMSDNSLLGEQRTPIACGLVALGCYAEFANGAIYATPLSVNALTDTGILQQWRALGAENSWLGYPTGQPHAGHTSAHAANGITYQTFDNGTIIHGNDGSYTITQDPEWDGSDGTGCSYATGGGNTYQDSVCWLDMAGYDETQARTGSGQRMTITLDGGYTATFTVKARDVDGLPGTTVSALSAPTYYSSGFGNTGFTGIAGKPVLVNQATTTGGTAGVAITIGDLDVRDRAGNRVTQYALVTGDAESTESGEVVTFTSDQQLHKLAALYPGTGRGCDDTRTVVDGNTVTCVGPAGGTTHTHHGPYWDYSQYDVNKSGNILYYANNANQITQTIKAGTPNGAVFGFMVTKASVTVHAPADAVGDNPTFSGTVSSGVNTSTPVTASRGETKTGDRTVFLSGSDLTFSITPTGTVPAWYRYRWVCTRNGTTDPTLTAGAGDGAQLTVRSNQVGFGDIIDCTADITRRAVTYSLQDRYWAR